MKKYILPTLIALLLTLQIVSLMQIHKLENRLQTTYNQLASQISNISSTVHGVYGNIDSLLTKKASIIDSFDYSFGPVDTEQLTIPTTFVVSPKETSNDTRATLSIAGASVVMERQGTTFTGTLAVDVFGQFDAKLILTDGDLHKTEHFNTDHISLRNRAIPQLFVRLSGKRNFGRGSHNTAGQYRQNGPLNIDCKNSLAGASFTDVRLVTELDGAILTDESIAPAGEWVAFSHDISETIALSAGQTYTTTVVATDSLGLVHQVVADEVIINADGSANHNPDGMEKLRIYNAAGKVVYDSGPEYIQP